MLPRLRQHPLKPNWWTILPVVVSLVLWGGIMYIGAVTGSAMDDRSERIAAISQQQQVAGR